MTEAINEAILSGHSCQMDPEHDFFAIGCKAYDNPLEGESGGILDESVE